jgi:hypothetical protein
MGGTGRDAVASGYGRQADRQPSTREDRRQRHAVPETDDEDKAPRPRAMGRRQAARHHPRMAGRAVHLITGEAAGRP